MDKWTSQPGKNNDVVISSRLRLARNFTDYMFVPKLSEKDSHKLVDSVISKFKDEYGEHYRAIRMSDCNDITKSSMKEQRIISSHLIKNPCGAVLISPDESASVMINAEDHIRIQVLTNGMNMHACYNKANELDDFIDRNFDYAFDEKFGYKTTYPTNLGTGMRAGYTLHLPGLSSSKKLNQIANEISRFGIRVKALYGDENVDYGCLYQLSNQKTLGHTEKEIIKDLNDIVTQLVQQEREQRRYLYENNKFVSEDMAFKSYGVLRYARKMSLRDSLTLLSEFMLGVSLGILKPKDETICINQILQDIQPTVIKAHAARDVSDEETDVIRADYLRHSMPELEVE